jgi:metal-dependent amidase/aminoacylase/carboxypeptidase family protein
LYNNLVMERFESKIPERKPEPEAGTEGEDTMEIGPSALLQEEIDFLREEVVRSEKHPSGLKFSKADKAIAEANLFWQFPEVGMEEVKTSDFLERRLAKILGKEKTGKVGGGVYGILEGDKPDGLTIFVRGDMDALMRPDDKPEHMCGHNIHVAWLTLNARLLQSWREKFGSLPFKRAVFIGEPNEEGAKHPEFGPEEMLKAGLLEKTGKPDLIIGAHTSASQPEGTFRVDKGAAYACDGRLRVAIRPKEGGTGSKRALYELFYEIGHKFAGERPDNPLSRRQVVDNVSKALPPEIVRMTDSKEQGNKKTLRPNSLANREAVSGKFGGQQQREQAEEVISQVLKEWEAFGVKTKTKIGEDGQFAISLEGPTGHVAYGGPNLKFIMAEIVHRLGDLGELSLEGDDDSFEAVGSVRINAPDWRQRAERIEQDIQQIIPAVVEKLGGAVEIEVVEPPKITVPPTVNDDRLYEATLRVLKAAHLETTNIGLPKLGAETFALWEEKLGVPGLYYNIGFGDKAELAELRKSGKPLPEKFAHHTPDVATTLQGSRAIPYGAAHSLILLEIAKSLRKEDLRAR